jgi:hypothetical protein
LVRDQRRPVDPDGEAPAPPPSRPARVELAAAILIVGGAVGLVGALLRDGSVGPASGDPFLFLTLGLNVGSIVAGVLVRIGRLWIVVVNYVAVLGFLDLLAAGTSPLALMLGLADLLVVVILFLDKGWFDEVRTKRSRRVPSPPAGG